MIPTEKDEFVCKYKNNYLHLHHFSWKSWENKKEKL